MALGWRGLTLLGRDRLPGCFCGILPDGEHP